MKKHPEHPIESVKITVEQRWHAARRLAAGDDILLAAARSGLHEDQLAWLIETDPGFVKLSQSAKAVQDLPPAERRRATAELAMEALEDQLAARNATVLNQTIKLVGELGATSEAEDVPELVKSALLLAALDWQELTQYLWIGVRDTIPFEDRGDMPFDPPADFAERVRQFTEQLQRYPIVDDKPANDDIEPTGPPNAPPPPVPPDDSD